MSHTRLARTVIHGCCITTTTAEEDIPLAWLLHTYADRHTNRKKQLEVHTARYRQTDLASSPSLSAAAFLLCVHAASFHRHGNRHSTGRPSHAHFLSLSLTHSHTHALKFKLPLCPVHRQPSVLPSVCLPLCVFTSARWTGECESVGRSVCLCVEEWEP